MILTFSSHIESADNERRVIAGKIVPFEEVGNTSVGKVVFAKGSIEIGDPGKVKMLMQHSPERPIGRMQKFNQAEDGIYASFKISASMQGQDALILAGEQLIDGLSVGVDVNKSIQKKDYLYVTSATLKEVSLVESPAFSAAQVTKVAASENEAEDTNQTTESEAPVEDLATAPQEAKAEAATPTVEAARPTITAPYISTKVRTPIQSMGGYTEHKIKAALGDDDSKLFIAAADDFANHFKWWWNWCSTNCNCRSRRRRSVKYRYGQPVSFRNSIQVQWYEYAIRGASREVRLSWIL